MPEINLYKKNKTKKKLHNTDNLSGRVVGVGLGVEITLDISW